MLNITCGPMFSGKSTALYNDIFGIPPSRRLIFKPNLDTREQDKIYIHSGSYISAITLDTMNGSMLPYISEDITHVFVDEIQFFPAWMARECKILSENLGLTVNVYGLDLNSNGNPWPTVQDILPYADGITRLRARCGVCNKPAKYTKKLQEDGLLISIGEQNKYEPRCEEHF